MYLVVTEIHTADEGALNGLEGKNGVTKGNVNARVAEPSHTASTKPARSSRVMMQQLLTGAIRLPIPDDDTEDDDAHDA